MAATEAKQAPDLVSYGVEGSTHDWTLVRLTTRGDKVTKREVLHAHDTKPVILGKLVKYARGM